MKKLTITKLKKGPQKNFGPLEPDVKNPPPVVAVNPRVGVKGVKRRRLRPCKKKMTKSKK